MKIKINNKSYSWNCKEYGNLKENVKVYLDNKERNFTPVEWDKIKKENNLDDKTLEIESLITSVHSKFNQFLYDFNDFKIDTELQKKELKKILERLTNKIKDKQLMLALDIFIKVNFDDHSNFHKKKVS